MQLQCRCQEIENYNIDISGDLHTFLLNGPSNVVIRHLLQRYVAEAGQINVQQLTLLSNTKSVHFSELNCKFKNYKSPQASFSSSCSVTQRSRCTLVLITTWSQFRWSGLQLLSLPTLIPASHAGISFNEKAGVYVLGLS